MFYNFDMKKLQEYNLISLPYLAISFFYWDIVLPLWRAPSKLIFGNTTGLRNNILPRIKFFLKRTDAKHNIHSENIQYIKELDEKGYLKLNKIDPQKIKPVVDQFNKCISDNSKTFSLPNGCNQTLIKDPLINMPAIKGILNDLKPLLLDISLGGYFIHQVAVKRNVHVDGALDHRDAGLSNAFHNDGFSCRDKMIFILLSDKVTKETGATKFINKKDSKKISRNLEYFSRRFLTNRVINEMYNKAEYFEGSTGDIIIIDTAKVLHGATIPKENSHRDMILITYTEDLPKKNMGYFLHFSK